MKPTEPNPLKAWLEAHTVTREEFSKRLGLSTPFVIDLVNEKHGDLRASSIDSIVDVTGIGHRTIHAWLREVRKRQKPKH